MRARGRWLGGVVAAGVLLAAWGFWALRPASVEATIGAHLDGDRLDAAEALLTQGSQKDPPSPRWRQLEGDLACSRGQLGPCLVAYREALEAQPSLGDAPRMRKNLKELLATEAHRQQLVPVLAAMGSSVEPMLVEAAGDDRYWARWNAVRALEARGQGERVDYVQVYGLDLLHAGSCSTRRRAATELGQRGDPRAIAFLKQGQEKVENDLLERLCMGGSVQAALVRLQAGADETP